MFGLKMFCPAVQQRRCHPDGSTPQPQVKAVHLPECVELTRRAEKLCAKMAAETKAEALRRRHTILDEGHLMPFLSRSPERTRRCPEGKQTYDGPGPGEPDFDVDKYLEYLETLETDSWEFYEYRLSNSEDDKKKQSNLPSQVPAPPVLRAVVAKPSTGVLTQTRRRLPPIKTGPQKKAEGLERNPIPPAGALVPAEEAPVQMSLAPKPPTTPPTKEGGVRKKKFLPLPIHLFRKTDKVNETENVTKVPRSKLPILAKKAPVLPPLAPKPPTKPPTKDGGARARKFLRLPKLPVKETDEVNETDTSPQTENDTKVKAGKRVFSNTDSFPKSRLPISVKRAPVMAPLSPRPPTDPKTNKREARPRHFLPPLKCVNDAKVEGQKIEEQEGLKLNPVPRSRLPILAKRAPVLPPLAPTKPKTKKEGGPFLPPIKPAPKEPEKKTKKDSKRKTVKYKVVERDPLCFNEDDIEYTFEALSSGDRNKVMSALTKMQALAQHHYHLIRLRLTEACVLVTKQVRNPRSEVAFEAMDTIAAMHSYLKKEMNPEVTITSQALLLKLADTSNDLIIERVNAVLDVIVENCSHKRVLDALMSNGLRHISSMVRCSVAQHLHKLFDKLGVVKVTARKGSFGKRFIHAVGKLSVDAVAEVRLHGQEMFCQMAEERNFCLFWKNFVPKRDHYYLGTLLRKARE